MNYFYSIFKKSCYENDFVFLQSFAVFILFGLGGVFIFILTPFMLDLMNTVYLALSIVGVLTGIYIVYPGFKLNKTVNSYSTFKVNILYYSSLMGAISLMALSLFILAKSHA